VGLRKSFGLSLTVSVRPLLKWISDPFPFRCMNLIVSKSISNSDFAMSWNRFHVAMFSTAPLKATIQFGNVAPTSGTMGTGMRSGPCSRWGPQSGSDLIYTLGDVGLYLGIFRYRSLGLFIRRHCSVAAIQPHASKRWQRFKTQWLS